jgi:hypothetical protein
LRHPAPSALCAPRPRRILPAECAVWGPCVQILRDRGSSAFFKVRLVFSSTSLTPPSPNHHLAAQRNHISQSLAEHGDVVLHAYHNLLLCLMALVHPLGGRPEAFPPAGALVSARTHPSSGKERASASASAVEYTVAVEAARSSRQSAPRSCAGCLITTSRQGTGPSLYAAPFPCHRKSIPSS